jgi:hypothetical protein
MDLFEKIDAMQTDCDEDFDEDCLLYDLNFAGVEMKENSSGGKTVNGLSFEQQEAIEDHILYHKKFIKYLECVKKGQCVPEPTKPDKKIDFLKTKKTPKVMSVEELNELLLKNQCNINVNDNVMFCDQNNDTFMGYEDFDQIEKGLHEANYVVNSQNMRIANNYLYFGRWLRRARIMHLSLQNKKQTWTEFVQLELKISYSQANKLISIAESFSKYKKFYSLSMSIEILYKHRKLITKYMSENKEFFDYWSS